MLINRITRWMLIIELGGVPVIAGFLAGWWSSLTRVPDEQIIIWAGSGAAAGLILDLLLFRKYLSCPLTLPEPVWMGVFIFYSVGCFGFFMGVPVFNVALAMPAGWLVGVQSRQKPVSDFQCKARRTALFTTGVLGVACCASAVLALSDLYTADNLQGMFRLGFEVTTPMIVGLIVVGGASLLIINWWLTITVVRWVGSLQLR